MTIQERINKLINRDKLLPKKLIPEGYEYAIILGIKEYEELMKSTGFQALISLMFAGMEVCKVDSPEFLAIGLIEKDGEDMIISSMNVEGE